MNTTDQNYTDVSARHGTPYEDDGTCDDCNCPGAVWIIETTEGESILCACCIIEQEL